MVRCSVDNEAAVNHDCNLVAKLLSFIHSVCSQKNRGHLHLFHHSVERATRNWIDSSCRLIQEKNFRAEHQGLGAAEFALVTTTEIFSNCVFEYVELERLHNQSFDTLSSLTIYAFQAGNEVHAFINCQVFPE